MQKDAGDILSQSIEGFRINMQKDAGDVLTLSQSIEESKRNVYEINI